MRNQETCASGGSLLLDPLPMQATCAADVSGTHLGAESALGPDGMGGLSIPAFSKAKRLIPCLSWIREIDEAI